MIMRVKLEFRVAPLDSTRLYIESSYYVWFGSTWLTNLLGQIQAWVNSTWLADLWSWVKLPSSFNQSLTLSSALDWVLAQVILGSLQVVSGLIT